MSIGILDIFGFEIFEDNQFEQFCINYANEKLQQHFNNHIFKLEQDEYRKEGIDVSRIDFVDNLECLALIESVKPLGILKILDEELVVPKGSDKGFVSKLHQAFAVDTKNKYYEMNKKNTDVFIVKHYAGDVIYNSNGFLAKNKDKIHDQLEQLLNASGVSLIKHLFDSNVEPPKDDKIHHARQSSAASKKVSTLGSQFAGQLASLMFTLHATAPHYIRCIKPNNDKIPSTFNTAMVLRQMKYAGLFEAIRIRKSGYPYRKDHADFVSRYRICLSTPQLAGLKSKGSDPKAGCNYLLQCLSAHLTASEWQMGASKVFLRNPQRLILDRLRDAALTKWTLILQAGFRGRLARNTYSKLQELVKKCLGAIQAQSDTLCREIFREANEAELDFFILQFAQRVIDFTAEQDRVIELLNRASNEEELSVLEGALNQTESLKSRFTEVDPEISSNPNKSYYLKSIPAINFSKKLLDLETSVMKTRDRVIRMTEARRALQDAVDMEDINLIRSALNEARDAGLPSNELSQAQNTLEQLEAEEKIMTDLQAAMAIGPPRDTDAIEAAIELTKSISLDAARKEIIATAKDLVLKEFESRVNNAISAGDENLLSTSLIPKLTSIGLKTLAEKCSLYLSEQETIRRDAAEREKIEQARKEREAQELREAEARKLREEQEALRKVERERLIKEQEAKEEAEAVQKQLLLEQTKVQPKKPPLLPRASIIPVPPPPSDDLEAPPPPPDDLDIPPPPAPFDDDLPLPPPPNSDSSESKPTVKSPKNRPNRVLSNTLLDDSVPLPPPPSAGQDKIAPPPPVFNVSTPAIERPSHRSAPSSVNPPGFGPPPPGKAGGPPPLKRAVSPLFGNTLKVSNTEFTDQAVDQYDDAEFREKALNRAMKRKDLGALSELLAICADKKDESRTVRIAQNVLEKLQRESKLIISLKKAVAALDVEAMKLGCKEASIIGLTDPIVNEARTICFSSPHDLLLKMLEKALALQDVRKCESLIKQAIADRITGPLIDDATDFVTSHGGAGASSLAATVRRATMMSAAMADDKDNSSFDLPPPPPNRGSVSQLRRSSVSSSTRRSISEMVALSGDQKESYRLFLDTRGSLPLSDFGFLRREGNYAKRNYFSKKELKSTRLVWQKEDIPRSLFKLSTEYCGSKKTSERVKKQAPQLFKNILGYMGDVFHSYPTTLAFEVITTGANEPLLRDEIFCQLMKQLTQNPSKESVTRGLKLFYLCIKTFSPSKQLGPYVLSLLAEFAPSTFDFNATPSLNTIPDLAIHCFFAYEKIASELRTKGLSFAEKPPTLQDIDLLTNGLLQPSSLGTIQISSDGRPHTDNATGNRNSVSGLPPLPEVDDEVAAFKAAFDAPSISPSPFRRNSNLPPAVVPPPPPSNENENNNLIPPPMLSESNPVTGRGHFRRPTNSNLNRTLSRPPSMKLIPENIGNDYQENPSNSIISDLPPPPNMTEREPSGSFVAQSSVSPSQNALRYRHSDLPPPIQLNSPPDSHSDSGPVAPPLDDIPQAPPIAPADDEIPMPPPPPSIKVPPPLPPNQSSAALLNTQRKISSGPPPLPPSASSPSMTGTFTRTQPPPLSTGTFTRPPLPPPSALSPRKTPPPPSIQNEPAEAPMDPSIPEAPPMAPPLNSVAQPEDVIPSPPGPPGPPAPPVPGPPGPPGPSGPSSSTFHRPKASGGGIGDRSDLLAAIRAGASLKKTGGPPPPPSLGKIVGQGGSSSLTQTLTRPPPINMQNALKNALAKQSNANDQDDEWN